MISGEHLISQLRPIITTISNTNNNNTNSNTNSNNNTNTNNQIIIKSKRLIKNLMNIKSCKINCNNWKARL